MIKKGQSKTTNTDQTVLRDSKSHFKKGNKLKNGFDKNPKNIAPGCFWCYKEHSKAAIIDIFKMAMAEFNSLKKNKDAAYYVTEAIKSEKDAIESYEEALKLIDELPYELYSIIQGNYYDEVEHLNNLHTLEIANSACATLSWY